MVARGSTGSSSSQVSPPVSVQEKGSRNKRKSLSDPPLGDPTNHPSPSQTKFSSYEFSAEKSQNIPINEHGGCHRCSLKQDRPDALKPDLRLSGSWGSLEVGSNQPREEVEADKFDDADWSDLTESQLEELILSNLDIIFKSAVKKISAFGYSEEVATKAVLRPGLCYGCKDTVSNIVDNTLGFLRNEQEIDASRDHLFEDLQQLEKYVLAEMVCVLREVRPSQSIGDAMWCLLICDINVSNACAMDGDSLYSFRCDEALGGSSSVSTCSQLKSEANNSELNLPNSNKPNPLFPCAHSTKYETPTVAGTPNSRKRNPLVLEGLPPKKENPISPPDAVDKLLGFAGERVQTTIQSSAMEEKLGSGRKGHSTESLSRQKSLHQEKSYRAYGSKGDLRTGRLSGLGGLILDKKQKSLSDSTGINVKNASLETSEAVELDAAQADGIRNLSINAGISSPSEFNHTSVNTPSTLATTNTPSALATTNTSSALTPASPASALHTSSSPYSLPTANIDLSLSLPTEINNAQKPISCPAEVPNCSNAGIPCDKSMGQCVPSEKQDEMIQKLVSRVEELQNELKGWTDWANQKVKQATRRLSKDNAELKTLRQEQKEVAGLKKEKQMLEENTLKKLSDLEYAFGKASGQVERANSSIHRLEVENSRLRQEMEAAKLRAAELAVSCQEVSNREKKTQKKFQSWEKQKTLFQEELVNEKRKLGQLQQELQQAKDLQDQLEARRKQEEKAKEELLMQASSIRKEREQIEASAKSAEDMISLKAENDLQRYKVDIQKLENEISQLTLKTDSLKIAALRRGIDGSYASRLTDGRTVPAVKGIQIPYTSEMADFQDNSGTGGVKRERECVMCLSEEMSVVFLPCAHQVVCKKCNDLHEKQGMKDCPSCRTSIQRRISVNYAHP